jgi:hypothetical protein
VSLCLSPLALLARLGHRLTLTSKTVRVLEDLARLRWGTLRLVLGRSYLTWLLSALLIGLRFLSLQDGWLLRCLWVDRLRRKLSAHLLLPLLSLMMLMLVLVLVLVLVLLRPLQNLRRIVAGRTTMHTRKRRLSMRELLWRIAWRRALKLHLLLLHMLRHLLLNRRSTTRLVADALCAHHSLDLVQAHQLPRGSSLGSGRRRLALRLMVALLRLLLRLQTPDICTCLQLRDVLGVFVALVATAVRLRSLRHRRLVLLRRALTGLEKHLLFLQNVGDLGGLAGKVEVLVNRLLNRRTAKSVVVEGIVGVIERVAEAIVGLLEVDAELFVSENV